MKGTAYCKAKFELENVVGLTVGAPSSRAGVLVALVKRTGHPVRSSLVNE